MPVRVVGSGADGVIEIARPGGVVVRVDRDVDLEVLDRVLAALRGSLGRDPFAGDVFVFRGRGGDRVKLLYFDGLGLSLFAKRLERGTFV